jgi:hypothetical protein
LTGRGANVYREPGLDLSCLRRANSGSFNGNSIAKLGARDVRFTRNKANNVIYAIVLGLPTDETTIEALGTSSATNPGQIAKVEVLGPRRPSRGIRLQRACG